MNENKGDSPTKKTNTTQPTKQSAKRLVEREKLRLGFNPNDGSVWVGEIHSEDGGLDPRKSKNVSEDFFRIVSAMMRIAEAKEKRESTPLESVPTEPETKKSNIILPFGDPGVKK